MCANLDWIDGVHRVAPGAPPVAAAESYEVRRGAGVWALALNRRPEDFDHWEGRSPRRLETAWSRRCDGHPDYAASADGWYGAGSLSPFSSNARSRSRHESQWPHDAPEASGW